VKLTACLPWKRPKPILIPAKPNLLHDSGPSNRTVTSEEETLVIEFHSSRHLVMKANNVIGPYDSVEVPVQFRFTFLHSHPDRFVELCTELFRLVNGAGSKGFTTPELDSIMKPMLDRPFDPSNLCDVRERPLTSNLRCSLVTPLQSKPGCAIVTSERIYFQPAVGVLNDGAVTMALSWLQCDLVAKARRYSGLRDSAVELYWKDGSSVLLAFERPREREKVMRLLPKHVPCHTDREFVIDVLREWQNGMISNYDYLLALNSAAGRTFHDLSRYPVFPWVIADYESEELDLTNEATFRDLSKPMGALNEERLEYFSTRLHGMHDMEDPFLYGTHYSAPGYVLYYLVRNMPEHMLCLQNGKFDAADRMFYSIPHCYSCALTNHADVKELIPEFYNPASGFDFLINARSLQLGKNMSGYMTLLIVFLCFSR
jgi:factor associated with neutral sphingomyelinase activation